MELLNDDVEAELRAPPRDMLARFQRIVELVESQGLEHVHKPHIKHLEDKLWLMGLRGKDGISRAIYVTAHGKHLVVVRFFYQENKKTPRKELVLAFERARELDQ